MAPEWIKNLKDGDTLYLANRWGQGSRNAAVVKVGRTWIHLGGGMRISRETGQIKDCYSYEPYPSAAIWKTEQERSYKQRLLAQRINEVILTNEQMGVIERMLDLAPKKIQP